MGFSGRALGFMLLYIFPAESAFRYEDCSTKDSIIELTLFNVLPDPVDMNKNLTITARGEIQRDIPSAAKLEIKYYRLRQVFGMQLEIPIPCILGKYGSCTLPFCDYMERFKLQVCPFFDGEIACACPPKAGIYGGDSVEIEMAETSAVGRFMAKGKYRTELRLKDEDGEQELACFKFYTELT